MTLRQLYEGLYDPIKLLGKSPATGQQYHVFLNHWEHFRANVAIAEIDDLLVAEFMRWQLSFDRAPTVNKSGRLLKALLNFAAKRNLIANIPDIPRLPEELELPMAFLLDEIAALLQEASRLPGRIAGIPANLWMTSFLATIYDSGARIGAVQATSTADVSLAQSAIRIRAASQKNKQGQWFRLSEQTCDLCNMIWSPDRGLMWPWPWRREALYRRFRRILDRAGVKTHSGTGSLFHRIRKSTASYLKAAGGDPTAQLGHSHPSVTDRYLDPRICGPKQAADMIPRPKFHLTN